VSCNTLQNNALKKNGRCNSNFGTSVSWFKGLRDLLSQTKEVAGLIAQTIP
jgi:hypothetical protein